MRSIIVASILAVLALAGCASPTPTPTVNVKALDGQTVDLVGRAIELPNHAEKSNGVGVVVGQDKVLFVGDFRTITPQALGARIRVKGIVRKKNLPMFHSEPGDTMVPQGIPVAPKTDIAKESIYYVLENPTWELIEQ